MIEHRLGTEKAVVAEMEAIEWVHAHFQPFLGVTGPEEDGPGDIDCSVTVIILILLLLPFPLIISIFVVIVIVIVDHGIC